MNIKCEKNILLNNINIVLKSVSSRTTVPILECILLTADKEGFRLTSNDLELGIETSNIDADVLKKGIVAIDAHMFFDIIKSMPDGMIDINVDEKNVVIIKGNETEFKMIGQNGEEFPILNKIEKENIYKINSLKLKNMIKQTKFSISNDETKPILTGALLQIKDGYLNVVAIDSFRVSFRKEKLEEKYEDTEVVVPGKTLNEIIKLMPDQEDEYVSLYFNDNYIMFEIKECKIVSRILEGEYIKYEQIFTKDYNSKIFINKTELLDSLERATLISKYNKKITPVKLDINANENLTITSKTDIGSSYEENVKMELEGDEITINFNPKYLIEALRVIEDENIAIFFITSLSPLIIKNIEDENYKYLILPLKVN